MGIYLHEMKRGRMGLLAWGCVIGGMIALCLLLYPELTKEGASIQAAIESMGTFTAAFGADRLNYAELMGFYGIYGGCMLGIGGIFLCRGTWNRNVGERRAGTHGRVSADASGQPEPGCNRKASGDDQPDAPA